MREERDNNVLQTIRTIKDYGYMKLLYFRITSNWFYNRHPEYRNEIEYLRKKKHWAIFPYEFMDHYVKDDYPAYEDKESGYIYVMHDGKPLFFHKEWGGCEEISKMYYYFLQEQNEASPHKYFTKEFYADKDDIMIDVGCAEGMQTLDIIDNIKEAYLFEYDEKWIGPLNKTFAPYMEKCHIIKKMVTLIREIQMPSLCVKPRETGVYGT